MADIKEIQKSKVGISLKKGKANRYSSLVILGVLLVVVFGFVRIYYGGGIGLKVVFKNSFSFKDTIVNLDDIIGLPRIVVATKHPAVKRQLEEMGFIQTDEQVKEEFEYESKKEYDRIMREAEEESKRLMKELKKEYGI